MKLVLFLIIIVLVVNTIVATIMGKKEDLRAAHAVALLVQASDFMQCDVSEAASPSIT